MYQVYSKIFIVYSWKYLRKARENICCVNLPRWRRWMCCWCGRRRWDAGWRWLVIGRPAAGSGSDWSGGRHVTPSCPPIGPRPQVAAPPAVARGKLLGSTFSWWWRCRVSAEYWFLPWSKLRPTSPSSLPPSPQPPPNLGPQLLAATHIPVCIEAAELSRLPPDIWPLRHQSTVSVHSSASKRSIRRFVITEKAPTRAFSWLKAATTAFTFKTLLRHYAKQTLTPR